MNAQFPDTTGDTISAVVLSFNAARYLDRCLATLSQALDALGTGHEVLVFENGSTDGSAALLRKWAQRRPDLIRPLFSDVNLGTTVSRNRALTVARGEYVLVLDADAFVNAEAIRALRARLASSPTVGLAVPKLRYGDGRFQLSVDEFPTLARKFVRLFRLRQLEQAHLVPAEAVEVDYAISACWMLPRRVVEEVGTLDENIFYSPEDVDYCARIGLAGYAIVYDPCCVAIHDAQELSRSRKLNGFFSRHLAGLLYFFRKHGCLWQANDLRRRIAQARRQRAA